jgi:MobA/MobL family protein
MASYHFSVQIISRSAGQSSVAAAAYRAGERLKEQRSGKIHDYSKRRGVVSAEILLPRGAANFLGDRSALWSYVERLEGRRDAQLAREINLALPHELDANARRHNGIAKRCCGIGARCGRGTRIAL